ncbi:hypothetical protein ACIKT0_07600 [Hansschlegelia beijingensis]|uniref:hypothetical protein n=1 Tax=Hansschlegelia beijingensis TaxID=1133344 RepID=UPI00387F16D0
MLHVYGQAKAVCRRPIRLVVLVEEPSSQRRHVQTHLSPASQSRICFGVGLSHPQHRVSDLPLAPLFSVYNQIGSYGNLDLRKSKPLLLGRSGVKIIDSELVCHALDGPQDFNGLARVISP